jgi:hypothetical protein
MKMTWDKNDSSPRRSLSIGFVLFILGIGVVAYCGYMEQYEREL